MLCSCNTLCCVALQKPQMWGCLNAPLLDQREHLGNPSHAHYRKQNRCCFYRLLFFLSLSLSLCLTLLCSVFTSHLPPCYLQPASQPIFPRSSWQRWWNIKRMPAPAHSTGVILSLHQRGIFILVHALRAGIYVLQLQSDVKITAHFSSNCTILASVRVFGLTRCKEKQHCYYIFVRKYILNLLGGSS